MPFSAVTMMVMTLAPVARLMDALFAPLTTALPFTVIAEMAFTAVGMMVMLFLLKMALTV